MEPPVRPFTWRFTLPLLACMSLNPINSSLIATALVPMAADVNVSVGRIAILLAALYLASAVGQPTAGRLADLFGPRRVLFAGLALVLAGGILGGVAQNLATLVVARVLIGLGTATAYPCATLLIAHRAASAGLDRPPGAMLGGLSVAGTVTIAFGPALGGLIVGTAGWRWTFLVNVPVVLAAYAMIARWVPPDGPPAPGGRGRTDAVGIALFAGAMTALLVFIMSLPEPRWPALVVAVPVAAVLVWWELRTAGPFIDFRLLATNGALTRTYVRGALTVVGSYTTMFGVTQYLQAVQGFSAQTVGLLLVPMGAIAAVAMLPTSRRASIRGPLILGAAMAVVAPTVLLVVPSAPLPVVVATVTTLFGISVGATHVCNQIAVYAQAPPDRLGVATGLFRTFTYTGSIASATVTTVVFHREVTDGGLYVIGAILVGVGLLVLLMTLTDTDLRRRTPIRTPP